MGAGLFFYYGPDTWPHLLPLYIECFHSSRRLKSLAAVAVVSLTTPYLIKKKTIYETMVRIPLSLM